MLRGAAGNGEFFFFEFSGNFDNFVGISGCFGAGGIYRDMASFQSRCPWPGAGCVARPT